MADAARAASADRPQGGPGMPPPATSEAVPCLVLLSEQHGDHVFLLESGPNLIGRTAGARVRIPDVQVSSRHAEVFSRGGGWFVRDLGSKNGTAVNGEDLRTGVEQALRPNDRIEVAGAATLFFTDRRFATGPTLRIDPSIDAASFAATGPTDLRAPEDDSGRDHPSRRAVVAPAEVEERLRDVRPVRVEGGLDERRLSILYQLAEALGRTRSERDLLEHALELTLALVPADRGSIFLGDERTLAAGASPPRPAVFRRRAGGPGGEGGVSTTVLEEVLTTRSAVAATDAAQDERFRNAPSIARHGIRAVMAAPIIAGDRILGVICLDSAAPGYLFNRTELMLVSAIAYQTGLALENARLVRTLEERVAERTAEIERLSNERARLLAIAAHDLKTPLAGVLGYVECLVPQAEADPGAAWLAPELGTVADSVRDMIELLNDLLDRQRAEAGRIDLAPEPLDLGALIRRLGARYERWAQGMGRSVVLGVEEGLPVVDCDPRRLTQVLNNLVHNALKHTRPGGKVFIQARPAPPAFVEVTVGDEGRGFDAAETGRLLGFFERGTAAEPPVGVGHGLGLAIVDKLVRLIGGKLSVESSLGRGARFGFTIPIGKTSPAAT